MSAEEDEQQRPAGPARPSGEAEVPTAPAEGVDDGTVAGVPALRRIAAVAAGYGIVAGLAFAIAGNWRRGITLTLAAAVSIVALRSLEGVVRHLRAAEGEAESTLGWRYPLRLFLLAGPIFILVIFMPGWRDPLAVLLGLSAVPLALLVEAGRELLLLAREQR